MKKLLMTPVLVLGLACAALATQPASPSNGPDKTAPEKVVVTVKGKIKVKVNTNEVVIRCKGNKDICLQDESLPGGGGIVSFEDETSTPQSYNYTAKVIEVFTDTDGIQVKEFTFSL